MSLSSLFFRLIQGLVISTHGRYNENWARLYFRTSVSIHLLHNRSYADFLKPIVRFFANIATFVKLFVELHQTRYFYNDAIAG